MLDTTKADMLYMHNKKIFSGSKKAETFKIMTGKTSKKFKKKKRVQISSVFGNETGDFYKKRVQQKCLRKADSVIKHNYKKENWDLYPSDVELEFFQSPCVAKNFNYTLDVRKKTFGFCSFNVIDSLVSENQLLLFFLGGMFNHLIGFIYDDKAYSGKEFGLSDNYINDFEYIVDNLLTIQSEMDKVYKKTFVRNIVLNVDEYDYV